MPPAGLVEFSDCRPELSCIFEIECCPHCKTGHWLVVEQVLADRAAITAPALAACRGPP